MRVVLMGVIAPEPDRATSAITAMTPIFNELAKCNFVEGLADAAPVDWYLDSLVFLRKSLDGLQRVSASVASE